MAGLIDIPDYWENRDEWQTVEWVAPGWSWIDPQREVAADISAIQNGGKTMAQWCAERGYDWREQLEQMALEKKTAEALGLKLSVHTPISVQAALSNHTDANGNPKGEPEDTKNEESED